MHSRERSLRKPNFEAVQFCRIFHVLVDSRRTIASTRLMDSRARDETYSELVDPWTDHIAPVFNDESFQPQPVNISAGRVTKSGRMSINPAMSPYEREAGMGS